MNTCLVTGAAGNLGRAVTERFLREGYRVVGSLSPGSGGRGLQADSRLDLTEVDLNDEAATAGWVNDSIQRYGRLDAAVLTVGGFAMGTLAETGSEDILRQYKLNFETAYHVARPVFQHMKETGAGRIFLIGSKAGERAERGEGLIAYGLAKSLLFRLAELMNLEAKGTDVVTAVLVPGTLDTAQNREAMPEADYRNWVEPAEVASIISFYCSAEAFSIREPLIHVFKRS